VAASPNAPTILRKELMAPRVTRYVVWAPEIARARRPGQFVIVRPRPDSERIPLTIAAGGENTITLVVQEVGKTTAVMADMTQGEDLADLCGPLGEPTRIEKVGEVAVVAGGIGVAPALPIAAALKEAGNHVVAVLGARTRSLVIMEREMRRASDELLVVTDDGSSGSRGLVTDALGGVIAAGRRLRQVVAVGPAVMMRAVAELTRPLGIPTVVSLNTIMVDGTGMCGGCRVSVGGQTRFVCVDGPEFDAHLVDFELMLRREAMYRPQERQAYEAYLREREGRRAAAPAERA
jgi:ferredoxin/flavodoxin---NADP+ reductase